MNIEQIVSQNIIGLRSLRKMSQEALALDAGMSRAYVGEIERAEKKISINRLGKLAKVLGVEPNVLPYKTAK